MKAFPVRLSNFLTHQLNSTYLYWFKRPRGTVNNQFHLPCFHLSSPFSRVFTDFTHSALTTSSGSPLQ